MLIGRLTRDPELRYTPNGVPVGNFDLAVDRPANQQGEHETDFIRIVCWQKQAENVANYVKKGRMVAVEGRLQIRNYETQDGQKRKAAEVVASYVQFLDKAPQGEAAAASSAKAGMNNMTETPGDASGVNLDDLPF